MKKIIAVTIAIILTLPQQTYALRPMAVEAMQHDETSNTAHIAEELGKDTTFTIRLPIIEEEKVVKRRMTIIDDEDVHITTSHIIHSIAQDLFRKFDIDMEVTRTDDGASAFARKFMDLLGLGLSRGEEVLVKLHDPYDIYPQDVLNGVLDVFERLLDSEAITAGSASVGANVYFKQIVEILKEFQDSKAANDRESSQRLSLIQLINSAA